MSDTITITHGELAAIVARAVASAMAEHAPQRSAGAERTRRYRERQASQSVTKRHETSQSVTFVTPPSPPSPPPSLSPTPPIPAPTPAPTPVQVQVSAHTREAAGDLFGAASAIPGPPHKRIQWTAADSWQGIIEADRRQFAAAAPAVDIERALSSADLWLRANPAKAKKQNFYRYLVNWLARQQERGGDTASTKPATAAGIESKYGPVQPNKWAQPAIS